MTLVVKYKNQVTVRSLDNFDVKSNRNTLVFQYRLQSGGVECQIVSFDDAASANDALKHLDEFLSSEGWRNRIYILGGANNQL